MNFTWGGIGLFVLIAGSALALIAVCDLPPGEAHDPGPAGVAADSASPGSVASSSSVAGRALLQRARETGNARQALDLLRAMQGWVPDAANLARVAFVLEEELGTPEEAARRFELIGETSPALDARREALATIAGDHDGSVGLHEMIRLLRDIQMDEAVTAELEAFFLPEGREAGGPIDLLSLCDADCPADRLASLAMAAADGRAGGFDPADCLLVADRFRKTHRPRARLRWLLRGLEAAPTSSPMALALSDAWLDAGNRDAALMVLSTVARSGSADVALQRRRSEIAAWLSRSEDEVEALEATLAGGEDPATRQRLIELYRHLGRPEEAVPHAAVLARAARDISGLGDAADLALAGGDLDLAVELLEEASALADDPRPWRERLVEFYLQDLQVDAALAELQELHTLWPEEGYDDRLYELLGRLNRHDELAEILLLRLKTDPDPDLEAEAIALCSSLGRVEQVRALMARRLERVDQPLIFFRSLKAYSGAGLDGLLEKAMEMSRSPALDEGGAAEALAAVLAMHHSSGYRVVAEELLARFPALAERPPQMTGTPGEFAGAFSQEGQEDWVPWLAERFFAAGWLDLSLVLYESLAEESPEDARTWTRIGQIAAWSNDPHGAIISFEQALAIEGPGDGELLFYLGEAYWSCQQEARGRAAHEQALELLRNAGFASIQRSSMEAKILARFDREAESRAIFDRLIALMPGNQDLLLDYADALVILGREQAARHIIDQARLLGAESPRALRMDAQLMLIEGRFEEVLTRIDRAIELYGMDPGYAAARAEALLGLGHLARARDAYDELLSLQPENLTAREGRRSLDDRLASPVASLFFRTESAADDRIQRIRLEGSLLLDADETRVSGYLERGWYSGRATAYRDGLELLDTDLTSLGLSVSRRLGPEWELALGPDFYPDRPGGDPLGAWVEVVRQERDPYARLELRMHLLETMTYPAAAVGLGGRSSGIELLGYRSGKDADWWAFGRLRYSNLSIETARDGRISDDMVILEGSVGTWLSGFGPQVQKGLLARNAEPARVGSTVAGEPPETRGPRIGVWAGYAGMKLLDGADLAGPLPIRDVAHYVTVTGRIEESLCPGLIVEAEAYMGTDLADPELFAGALLGLSWRPRPDFDIGFRGTYGYAFGRADAWEGASSLELRFTFRW